ncbi:xylulose kinase-1 [Tanacetum coccineum]|uniref:Xylulose kinase-1 n=1 Tax=Tanacetum coccineum TaxID=301880 RepID=A0ABQ5HXU1_9ASTR
MSTPKFAETHNLVVFLEKPEESNGFKGVIDFLNASSIKYALTVNPTVYESCIKQFWATAKAKTVNEERQIQALVDKKKVIITEKSVKNDLMLKDAEGTDCLPNDVIFEQLTLMGAKTTAWNEFSSTMASAIIKIWPLNFDMVGESLCIMVHDLGMDDLVNRKPNEQRKLVCFDVAKEEFGLIDHPKYQAERDGTFKDLVQLDGEVGLAYNNVGQSVKIWVLSKYEWVLHCQLLDGEVGLAYNNVGQSVEIWVLSKYEWVLHCQFDQKPPLPSGYIKILGSWNKERDILMTYHGRKQLFIYSLKLGVSHEVSIVGLEENGCQLDKQSVGFKRLQDILRVTAAQLQLLSDYYCWKDYADRDEIKDLSEKR